MWVLFVSLLLLQNPAIPHSLAGRVGGVIPTPPQSMIDASKNQANIHNLSVLSVPPTPLFYCCFALLCGFMHLDLYVSVS